MVRGFFATRIKGADAMRMRASLLAISLALAYGVLAADTTRKDPPRPSGDNAPVASWAQVEGPIQGQSIQGETPSPDAGSGGVENRIVFMQDGSQAMEAMRARLADPEQRRAMRAEYRAGLEGTYSDVEQELRIDSTTREALFELLSDQSLESMDAMFGENRRDAFPSMQVLSEAENRKLDQLRELLGEDGLQRYQEYMATVYERHQVREVDGYLAAADKLSPEQRSRLIALFTERNRQVIPTPGSRRMSTDLRSRDPGSPTFQQDMQRESQLATIESNEQLLLLREAANRGMARRAADFLTPAQSAALAKVNAVETAKQRKWIEQARVNAGLDPAIPEHQEEAADPLRKAVSGVVTLDLVVRVNGGEPVHVTHTGPNGETLKFQASEELFAEAEWTLYDDNWLYVQLTYFEEGPNGRRQLPGMSGFGTMGRTSSDTTTGDDGIGARSGSGTIVTGRKAYSVEISASAIAQ